ncbi:MAG: serine hydrolase domain-containing protein [Anaerolineales bacterium]
MRLNPDRLDGIVTPQLQALVDRQAFVGFGAAIWQGNDCIYQRFFGHSDREAGTSFGPDTIVRMYSMTKPMVGALVALFWERGLLQLDDPVAAYIPAFADTPVYVSGGPDGYDAEPQNTTMTLRHLSTHCAGLSYGFDENDPVDQLYRQSPISGYLDGTFDSDLEAFTALLAQLPLRFHPGTAYHYSFAIDVLGRVLEIVADASLRDLVFANLFEPLGMQDTDFYVTDDQRSRLAPCYSPLASGGLARMSGQYDHRYEPGNRLHSGGGGLVSTLDDYGRFLRMLLHEGELDGVRVLSREAVRAMMSNHLPQELIPFEATSPGLGYGLCGAVRVAPDPARPGEPIGVYSWGGAASTAMWVDPVNAIAGLFTPQLMNGDARNTDTFRRAVYAAL